MRRHILFTPEQYSGVFRNMPAQVQKHEKGGNGKEQYLSHTNLKKKVPYRRDQCGCTGRWHDIRQIYGHEICRKEPDIKSEDRNDKRTVKRGFRKA